MKNILIQGFDHQGRGIYKENNNMYFIENALPNENVDFQIYNNKKNIYFAKTIKINSENKSRVKPRCPFYNICGGCDLQHMSYDYQLNFKQEKEYSILYKFFDENIDKNIIKKIIPSDLQYEYRNKISLKCKNGKIGYYKKNSNDLVPIDKCLLADKILNNLLNKVENFTFLYKVNDITIRNINSIDTSLTICINNNLTNEEIKELKKLENAKWELYMNNKLINTNVKSNIIANLGDFKFYVNSNSFFQVNNNQTIKLYNKVIEYLDANINDNVLDLYCGTGTIGLFVSKKVNNVLGIEINKEAIKNAFMNKELNNINNINFICNDAAKEINKIKKYYDKIIIDPPRSGLLKSMINDIFQINPKRIVYVSCDPVTLARDLKLLSEKYYVKEITPFDMFPNTYHIETVVCLSNKNSKKKDYVEIGVDAEDYYKIKEGK